MHGAAEQCITGHGRHITRHGPLRPVGFDHDEMHRTEMVHIGQLLQKTINIRDKEAAIERPTRPFLAAYRRMHKTIERLLDLGLYRRLGGFRTGEHFQPHRNRRIAEG